MISINSYRAIIPLVAGITNVTINNFNMPQPPIAARGTIMKQGAGASNLTAHPDYASFSIVGGTFYFDSVIPSDSTTYLLLFEFFI